MKIIIGLGNPGGKFKNNRHNVGYMTANSLLSTVHSKNMIVKKSDKFMNDSGSFVLALSKTHNLLPKDLFIVHDDLDIKLGEYKIQFGKGPKGHNGILDIEEKLGTSEFWRVRMGVDNRITNDELRIKGEQYVLEDFTKDELEILQKTIKALLFDINENYLNKN